MTTSSVRGPRSPAVLIAIGLALGLLFAGFVALGSWQVERRAWKLDLIARVDQRVHAPAVDAPGADRWATLTAADDEYRHVRTTGTLLLDRETLVLASTERGSGFWVMTPMQLADRRVVMINRGFVPDNARDGTARNAGQRTREATVTGLLRMSEPRGMLWRDNDPGADRWYSRDVQAIAAARGLSDVAPYFVDAAAGPVDASPAEPVGGLTVIAFHNSHLVYVITWYALALMVLGAAWIVAREELRLRRLPRGGNTGQADRAAPGGGPVRGGEHAAGR